MASQNPDFERISAPRSWALMISGALLQMKAVALMLSLLVG